MVLDENHIMLYLCDFAMPFTAFMLEMPHTTRHHHNKAISALFTHCLGERRWF